MSAGAGKRRKQTTAMNKIIQRTGSERAATLFEEAENTVHIRADRLFAKLMVLQWLGGIAAALWISPKTWIGATSQTHWHVWAAIFLGGAITSLPVYLALKQPGRVLTRHTIAVAQMFFSALLIHLTGGRLETHFHVFGSLAFLAFYRDWRVLISGTVVVALDHYLRGVFWPQSVFGVLAASPWRWVEHAGWVLFEDTFLIISIRHSLNDMLGLAERQASLEGINMSIEQKVVERTTELTNQITEREKIEAALHESQALYHSLVDQLPAGVFRKDSEGRFVFINSWFCRLKNLRAEQMLGKTPRELAAYELRSRDPENCGETPEIKLALQGTNHHELIMQSGKQIELEEQYARPDGETQCLHVVKSPVFGPDGRVVGSQGVLMDITQRKRAEAELDYERSLLRALMDKSDDRIYFKDAESRFLRYSASMAHLFKLENVEELAGKRDSDFFGDEHAREAFEDEQTIIRTGEPIVGKMEKEIWPDGRITWALTSKMALRDETGKITGTFGISKDITAIKEAEDKLNQVHKQLVDASRQAGMAEVATSVLHNVGNVLNSVNVSSSLIAEKMRHSKVSNINKAVGLIRAHENDLNNFFANDSKGRQLPGYLSSLATHLALEQEDILREISSLASNIMHIKEIVAMQQSYAKTSGVVESLKVADLVEDAICMNNGAMSRHQVKVVRDFAEVPLILTEKHKVLQILVNLIRNAKYACDDSGRNDKQILLKVANGNERIKISVIDNGIGIPPENLTRIFGHGFTTRKDGHGFGLHSGALAAREMGGTLAAFSDGPGRGATFTLELPVQKSK
jgi:PAS domain S-box-containing protein